MNCKISWQLFSIAVALCLVGVALAQTAPPQVVKPCVEDLAKRVSVAVSQVTLLRSKPVDFPDASLGLPEPDKMYAQVITPGWVLVLEAKNRSYLYAATEKYFRYGGPVDAAGASAVYLEKIPDEPNMNGNVVQVSLAGANPRLVLESVNSYWTQPDGSIIGARRTSRSGFNLLYRAPGLEADPIVLSSAFDFGEAAVSADGKRWVAYSRARVGSGWQVSWGEVKAATTPDPVDVLTGGGNRLALPDNTSPDRLYWHLTNPVAIVHEGSNWQPYELILNAAKPEWRKFQGFFPPPTEEFMLNKSETLVVKLEKNAEGQPVTRIVKQWFTGDEKPVCVIADFTPGKTSITPGKRFLVLSGQRGDQMLGFTVDLSTGEVLETVKVTEGPVRLLLAAPQGWIYSQTGASKVITPG
jgi:hypothetical protein